MTSLTAIQKSNDWKKAHARVLQRIAEGKKLDLDDLTHWREFSLDRLACRSQVPWKSWRHKKSGEVYTLVEPYIAVTGHVSHTFVLYGPEYPLYAVTPFALAIDAFLEKFEPIMKVERWELA